MWILEKNPNVYYIPKILNCVYGYKENIPNLNHSTTDFSTLIKCAIGLLEICIKN